MELEYCRAFLMKKVWLSDGLERRASGQWVGAVAGRAGPARG